MISLMQESCVTGEFCQQTHKPGLCKGQHRGDVSEPGVKPTTVGSDPNRVRAAQAQAIQAGDTINRMQVALAMSRSPRQQAAYRKAIAQYQKAQRGHHQTLEAEARAARQHEAETTRLKNQALRDEKEQDRLDRKKKQVKRSGSGSSGLKPFQTSTKLGPASPASERRR